MYRREALEHYLHGPEVRPGKDFHLRPIPILYGTLIIAFVSLSYLVFARLVPHTAMVQVQHVGSVSHSGDKAPAIEAIVDIGNINDVPANFPNELILEQGVGRIVASAISLTLDRSPQYQDASKSENVESITNTHLVLCVYDGESDLQIGPALLTIGYKRLADYF